MTNRFAPVDEKEHQRRMDAYHSTDSCRDMAKALNMNYQTVYGWTTKQGLKPKIHKKKRKHVQGISAKNSYKTTAYERNLVHSMMSDLVRVSDKCYEVKGTTPNIHQIEDFIDAWVDIRNERIKQ